MKQQSKEKNENNINGKEAKVTSGNGDNDVVQLSIVCTNLDTESKQRTSTDSYAKFELQTDQFNRKFETRKETNDKQTHQTVDNKPLSASVDDNLEELSTSDLTKSPREKIVNSEKRQKQISSYNSLVLQEDRHKRYLSRLHSKSRSKPEPTAESPRKAAKRVSFASK